MAIADRLCPIEPKKATGLAIKPTKASEYDFKPENKHTEAFFLPWPDPTVFNDVNFALLSYKKYKKS